jgi:ADP-ribosylglycohydrolase
MLYSLRDRFRGALLGAAIGELWGDIYTQAAANPSSQSIEQTINQMMNAPQPPTIASLGLEARWGKWAIQQLHRLVQLPESELDEWGDPGLSSPGLPSVVSRQQSENTAQIQASLAAGFAIATLPIALFYHDDLRRLPSQIEQAIAAYHQPHPSALEASTMGAVVMGYTLALALHEKLSADDLIARLLTDLEIGDRHPDFAQHLIQLQHWLNQNLTLMAVQAESQRTGSMLLERSNISSSLRSDLTPLVIALYGFLSTPHDFNVTVLRTARLQRSIPVQPIQTQPIREQRVQIACCLAGAVSGIYNSIAGIPEHWRSLLDVGSPLSERLAKRWQVSSVTDLCQQADLLFAAWSGVHQPSIFAKSPFPLVAARPDLIRPRSK